MTAAFPDRFTWGVSTSAYQIEGAVAAGGKGESIWDRFAHTPGRILGDDNGDVACDHYHRYEADFDLMADLGVDAYSFTIAWTRILPDGSGDANQAGIDFYARMVEALLQRGITPYATLYHWDLPGVLQDHGGWARRDTVAAFEHYADVVTRALGDRVEHWTTHNEPWVAAMVGHELGVHAPGHTDFPEALRAAHHLLLSHGRAVPIIRANVPGARVGLVLDCWPAYPTAEDPTDLAAQRRYDGYRNRWMFDPVFGKGYPADMIQDYAARGLLTSPPDFVAAGDLETIAAPIDFLGVNYYSSVAVTAANESGDSGVLPNRHPPPGFTEMGWRITPPALTELLQRLRDDYSPAEIVITENGASYSDGPGADGAVHDDRRIAYLRDHIAAVGAAIADGIPVTGYFVWSFMDNFEWSLGYSQRFGLVWIDFETLQRLPKDSFHWYRDVIARN